MALNSPGVQVSIVDESQYLPAAPASVPLIVLATAQNKSNAAGTGVATGTIAANANKLYRVTSQRDLTTLFGNPFFYKTTNGTPIQGYELNEYGLMAAYSVLGLTNLCYVLRADIDLASLVGRTTRPAADVSDGTYWLDTTNTTWGIFEFDQVTGNFINKTPLIVMETSDMADAPSGRPSSAIGNIGDYAISMKTNTANLTLADNPDTYHTYWYKAKNNQWVSVGGSEWRNNWPTIQGSQVVTSLTAGAAFSINGTTITIPAAPANTLGELVDLIEEANVPFVSAAAVGGRLEIYSEVDQAIIIAPVGSNTVLTEIGIGSGTYNSPQVLFGTNAQQPLWRSSDSQPRPTGSVWIKTNSANAGTNLVFNQYSAALGSFVSVSAPMSTNDWTINSTLDSSGGRNITEGSLYAQYNTNPTNFVGPLQVYRRFSSGSSLFVGTVASPAISAGATLKVRVSFPSSNALSDEYEIVMPSSPATQDASAFVAAWTAANIDYTKASVSTAGAIVLEHTEGGVIILDGQSSLLTQLGFVSEVTPGAKWGPYKTVTYSDIEVNSGEALFQVQTTGYIPSFTVTAPGDGYVVGAALTITEASPLNGSYQIEVTAVDDDGGIEQVRWLSGFATPQYTVQLSDWRIVAYIPNEIVPTQYPLNGTQWYYSSVNQVDIMTNVGGQWRGYRNVAYAANGLPKSTGTPQTDTSGPLISPIAPTTNSAGLPLQFGDLWIDTSDLENYPVINRWQAVGQVNQWVRIDNTDQTSENGVVFADARWASNGSTDPVTSAFPSIAGLLLSDYVDLDAPDPTLYPRGTLLFNTRRSGYNVKEYRTNYFNSADFSGTIPAQRNTWVSVSGLKNNGSPYMGRKAQRHMVVQALKNAINVNTQIREEDTFINLIAACGYPELQPDMVTLNNDRGQTAYVIGDTPLRLPADANAIVNWATNASNASGTGEDGLVTRNTYMGLYYPSGITTDLTGAEVTVPASHMILRTMIYSDNVAYPWFAPAGQRRGIVDNASNIGYIDAATGEFTVTKNRVALRDIEYTNFINPISYFTNLGILNYGNKNSFDSQSSLDRTNVARLVCYIRYQLQRALRPFIFEPNDTITRNEARGVVQTLMADILSKRGIYDYVVVCDESNNTPARIDRNELWIDIAIEPAKAVEFIYVPVRLLNTGEIGGA
jgi:hypothetical protein